MARPAVVKPSSLRPRESGLYDSAFMAWVRMIEVSNHVGYFVR